MYIVYKYYICKCLDAANFISKIAQNDRLASGVCQHPHIRTSLKDALGYPPSVPLRFKIRPPHREPYFVFYLILSNRENGANHDLIY